MRPRRRNRYDIHAVLAVHAEKLRTRREAAAAELAAEREAAAAELRAEREAAARLEDERQRARDAEWRRQCEAERAPAARKAPVLTWPKGKAI